MRISVLVLTTLFALGCSSDANKKLDEIADRACACKEAECAKKVSEDLQAWAKNAEGKRGDNEAAQKSMGKIMGCITKARLGGKADKAMDKADKAAEEAKEQAGDAKDKADKAVDEATK